MVLLSSILFLESVPSKAEMIGKCDGRITQIWEEGRHPSGQQSTGDMPAAQDIWHILQAPPGDQMPTMAFSHPTNRIWGSLHPVSATGLGKTEKSTPNAHCNPRSWPGAAVTGRRGIKGWWGTRGGKQESPRKLPAHTQSRSIRDWGQALKSYWEDK